MLRFFDYYFGLILVSILRICKRQSKKPLLIKKIGILKLRGIGDSVLVSSAIQRIKDDYPEAALVFIADKSSSVIAPYLGADFVLLISIRNFLGSIKKIRRERFDLIFDFGAWSNIEALITYLSGSRYSIGFKTSGHYRHYLYDHVVEHSGKKHEYQNYLDLTAIGNQAVPNYVDYLPKINAPHIQISPELERMALSRYVVFHPWPGGSNPEQRKWPAINWLELGQLLIKRHYQLLIVGGPEDYEGSVQLKEMFSTQSSQVFITSNQYNFAEVLFLIKNAKAAVCVNSGVMHISAALGTSTIGLHGPTSPIRWGPIGQDVRVVKPSGSDCGFLNLGYEYEGHPTDCMSRIGIKDVIDALDSFPHCE